MALEPGRYRSLPGPLQQVGQGSSGADRPEGQFPFYLGAGVTSPSCRLSLTPPPPHIHLSPAPSPPPASSPNPITSQLCSPALPKDPPLIDIPCVHPLDVHSLYHPGQPTSPSPPPHLPPALHNQMCLMWAAEQETPSPTVSPPPGAGSTPGAAPTRDHGAQPCDNVVPF